MTISAVVPDITFSGSSGSGTLGPFSLVKSGTPIVFYNNSEVFVYRYDAVTDTAPTLLVEGTDYTLTGGPTAGSITLTSPQTGLLTAERLYVYTRTSIAQALDLVNGGNFSSSNLERRLDIIFQILQQLDREVRSGIRFAMFDTDEIPKTLPLGAAIDKIPYVTGTASAPTVAYLSATVLADLSELSVSALANIATVAADLAGADTIGIVAAAIDDVEDVAADIADVGTVADFLNAGQFGSLSVTSGSDTQTLANWLTRVDRKDPTTLQVDQLNFKIQVDPTGTYFRRVGALWYNIESEETRASQGTWTTYTKTARLVSGNEIGRVLLTQWNDMASGAAWTDWTVATSPLNPASGLPGAPTLAQSFYVVLGEGNPQNRYADAGYTPERRLQDRWAGGWQWTPETQDFSGLLGGARRGYNVLFQHCYTHSPIAATDTQLQAKTYNLHLVEPNAVAPGGVVIMAQGHRTFVASAAVSAGGTGYVAGDVGKVVTVSGGGVSDLAATIEITTVAAGAVTGIRMYTGGRYDTSPSSPAATSGGGTTGSGLTVSLTMSTATSDPAAIIDTDDAWVTGFDFRKATFRDSVNGNNQVMRFVQPQGLAWSTTAGGTPYNIFGVNSGNIAYVAAVDNATGINFNTRANGKVVLAVDTSVGASVTDYVSIKGTASAGGEVIALSSNANADLVLRPLGNGGVDMKLAAGAGLEINTVPVLKTASESDWTPTIAATSGSITTSSTPTARYTRIGPMVFFTIVITVTDNGTGAGSLTFTLPSTPAYAGTAVGRNASTSVGVTASWTTTSTVNVNLATNAYPVASGQSLRISGSYLVA